MRRIQAYLDEETEKALTEFAYQKNLSISNAAADIIKNHFQGVLTTDECAVMNKEMKSYFLRIINTLNQVLICVYDSKKTTVNGDSAEECIQKITRQIQVYLKMTEQ